MVFQIAAALNISGTYRCLFDFCGTNSLRGWRILWCYALYIFQCGQAITKGMPAYIEMIEEATSKPFTDRTGDSALGRHSHGHARRVWTTVLVVVIVGVSRKGQKVTGDELSGRWALYYLRYTMCLRRLPYWYFRLHG